MVGDGEQGAYAHNWLSFLVAYGWFPSFCFCVLTVGGFRKALRLEAGNPGRPGCFESPDLWTLAILLSRSYLWPYIWLALASAAALESPSRRDSERRRTRSRGGPLNAYCVLAALE